MLTQIIDVRDLAEWIIRALEAGGTGVYNATGPHYPLTFGEVLKVSRDVSGSDASFTWVDEPFLKAENVKPWSELPLWITRVAGDAGLQQNQRRESHHRRPDISIACRNHPRYPGMGPRTPSGKRLEKHADTGERVGAAGKVGERQKRRAMK
jgi:nucleoside-diphosphate-sugar epimerase